MKITVSITLLLPAVVEEVVIVPVTVTAAPATTEPIIWPVTMVLALLFIRPAISVYPEPVMVPELVASELSPFIKQIITPLDGAVKDTEVGRDVVEEELAEFVEILNCPNCTASFGAVAGATTV